MERENMKKKRVVRVISFMLAAVLLVVLLFFFQYWPRYLLRKRTITTEDREGYNTLISCNVRCMSLLELGKRSWFYRADLLLSDVEAASPDIIGFQEVTKWQYGYLMDCLKGFDSIIEYRDQSLATEGCPIFFRTSRYALVEQGSFWLSETPEVMSKDWDSECYRICSYVILSEKESGKQFAVFNTHLDHVSDQARINGINVVLEKIEQFGGLPSVIMGDFNAEEGSRTYLSATEYFLDAAYEAGDDIYSATYQNWGARGSRRRIDYFMVSPTGLTVQDYCVLSVEHDGVYASDHNPIVMKITLN